MNSNEVQSKIIALAKKHQELDEDVVGFEIIFLYEKDALLLIVEYCENQGYLIDGFPTEKRVSIPEEEHEDYFTIERYQYYLDKLSLVKEDVAELNYVYQNSFWPDYYESKESFMDTVAFQLNTPNSYSINGF